MLIAAFIVHELINKVLVLKMHFNVFALHFLFEPRGSKSKKPLSVCSAEHQVPIKVIWSGIDMRSKAV